MATARPMGQPPRGNRLTNGTTPLNGPPCSREWLPERMHGMTPHRCVPSASERISRCTPAGQVPEPRPRDGDQGAAGLPAPGRGRRLQGPLQQAAAGLRPPLRQVRVPYAPSNATQFANRRQWLLHSRSGHVRWHGSVIPCNPRPWRCVLHCVPCRLACSSWRWPGSQSSNEQMHMGLQGLDWLQQPPEAACRVARASLRSPQVCMHI
jgi:hypothetical protein